MGGPGTMKKIPEERSGCCGPDGAVRIARRWLSWPPRRASARGAWTNPLQQAPRLPEPRDRPEGGSERDRSDAVLERAALGEAEPSESDCCHESVPEPIRSLSRDLCAGPLRRGRAKAGVAFPPEGSENSEDGK